MPVAPCPCCHDDVSVPDGFPPEATAQCPLCSEEFELSEVLQSMPPALLITSSHQPAAAMAPAATTTKPSHDEFSFAPSDDDNDEGFTLAPSTDDPTSNEQSAGDSPAFALDANSESTGSAGTTSTKSVTARPRKKKKQANPVLEVVKVALGGAAAIPMALLLMWYMPFGCDRDAFDVGPTISEIPVIGVIVPEKYSAKPQSADDDTSSAEGTEEGPVVELGSPDSPPGEGMTDSGAFGNQAVNDRPQDQTPANELEGPSLEELSTLDSGEEEPAIDDPGLFPDVDFPEVDAAGGNDDAGASPTAPRAPGGELLGPVDRPQVSPADLQASIEAVKQSVVAYAESAELESEERKAIAQSHYDDYGKLAGAVTFIDQTDPDISADTQSAKQILQDLGSDPAKAAIMQYFATLELSSPDPANKGIVLVGTVTQTRAMGRLFASKVSISLPQGASREVTIVSPANPAEEAQGFKQGSRVAILGSVVAKPAENMRGYKGNAAVAVWSGYFLVLDSNVQP